jgi:hypothetical protein
VRNRILFVLDFGTEINACVFEQICNSHGATPYKTMNNFCRRQNFSGGYAIGLSRLLTLMI